MNRKEPLVSIIIPNYNHSRYLKQRIDSVLNQSFQDFELIILDDCSTDNSCTVIEEYTSSNKVSHIVFNEKNSGSTFIQWQKGFSLAKGKYIWIAESDDYADLTFLEKLVSLLENNSDCQIAFSCSYTIDENGSVLADDWDRNKMAKGIYSKFEGSEFIKARMLFNNSIYNASMVVFRKSVLDKIDNRFMDFSYCGDWFFWYKICLQGTVIRYNEKLNYFRQHFSKVSPKAEALGKRFLEGKFVLKEMFKDLELKPIQEKVIIGRLLKKIHSSNLFECKELKDKVMSDAILFFGFGKSSVIFYELDKIFNFSKLSITKSRHL